METKPRILFACVFLVALSPSFSQKIYPLPNNTIEEKLEKIKILAGPRSVEYENMIDVRMAIISEIVAISHRKTPEATAALIDLMLSQEFDELDEHYVGKYAGKRLSNRVVISLLEFPLAEPPLITTPDFRILPTFKPQDPDRQNLAIKDYYSWRPDEALGACRAWCQEVRDGTRTFQFKGNKLLYNALGEPINAPPPRTHRRDPGETPPAVSAVSIKASHPAMTWIVGLLVLVIAGGLVRLGLRKALH